MEGITKRLIECVQGLLFEQCAEKADECLNKMIDCLTELVEKLIPCCIDAIVEAFKLLPKPPKKRPPMNTRPLYTEPVRKVRKTARSCC